MSKGLVNQAAAKRYILFVAGEIRRHKFTRVAPSAIAAVESAARSRCESLVAIQPSKGKTIR